MPTSWSKQHLASSHAETSEMGLPHEDEGAPQSLGRAAGSAQGQAGKRKGISLKGRALRLLSNREHSRSELQRKLQAYEEAPGQLHAVLDELAAKGFISHERVVASVVYRRAEKVGVRVVEQVLQQKGIAPAEMQDALAELKASELQRARAVWAKKFGEVANSPEEKAKQLRFLAGRGFGADVLYKVVGDFGDVGEW